MTLIKTKINENNTKNTKHVANSLSCGKNTLWFNCNFWLHLFWTGEQPNPTQICLVSLDMGSFIISEEKKYWNFHIFRMSWKLLFLKKYWKIYCNLINKQTKNQYEKNLLLKTLRFLVFHVLPLYNMSLLLSNTSHTENMHRLNTVMLTWFLLANFF